MKPLVKYLVVWAAGLAVPFVASATITLALGAAASATATTAKASPLPAGAATGFPFGYVLTEGAKTSLLPPNDNDVDQARLAHAPKVGPFSINPNGAPAGWPDACKLTSLTQLKVMEPSITGLRGAPVGSKAEILGTGHSAPHNTQCQFNLDTTFQPVGYGSTGSYVTVQLEDVGTGAVYAYRQALAGQKGEAHKYPAQYADYPDLRNGAQCFDDGNELQCLKGDVDFWVSGQKVTGGNYFGADQAVWIDQIQIPLAEELGAELKTAS
jgi:hypothetical protein